MAAVDVAVWCPWLRWVLLFATHARACLYQAHSAAPIRPALPSGTALAKAAALVLLGIPIVLWFTAGVALVVRKAVKTELGTFTFHAAKLEVTWLHWAAWGEPVGCCLVASCYSASSLE